jgi:protein-disulfide isomerase
MDQFNQCMSTAKYASAVEKDMNDGGTLGVNGTPAFFINGILLSGAVPFPQFKEIIDDEIKLARASGGKGTP